MFKGLSVATISPLFVDHVAEHGLNYGTVEEFNFRQTLFLERGALNDEINANEELTFTVGHNYMSTWTDTEYTKMLGHRSPSNQTTEEPIVFDVSAIPMAKDWRKYGALNPVKNQGQCGSCWTFAATCAMESHLKIQGGALLVLAEQNLVDCCHIDRCAGCNGGFAQAAMQYSQQNGQASEASYKYTARDGKCKNVQKVAYASQVSQVTPRSADQMMASIAATGPVTVAVEADRRYFQSYQSGVLNNAAQCGDRRDHAITAIGYGNDGSQKYYIVRNSWGPNWGLKGYINIAITEGNSDGVCGIQAEVWTVTMKN